jgi:vacuolar-type H+-ATPase subunit I/STV1
MNKIRNPKETEKEKLERENSVEALKEKERKDLESFIWLLCLLVSALGALCLVGDLIKMYPPMFQLVMWLSAFGVFSLLRLGLGCCNYEWKTVKEKRWSWWLIVIGGALMMWMSTLLEKSNTNSYLIGFYFISVGVFISGIHFLFKKKKTK